MAEAQGFTPTIVAKVEEEFDAQRSTSGKFATETVAWEAAVGESSKSYTLPLPISILAAYITSNTVNTGDAAALDVDPGKVVGVLPADVAAEQTVIPLPDTMAQAYLAELIIIGMRVQLDDGTNKDNLGLLLEVDVEGGTFTVQHATEHAFAAATPTMVKLTASMSPGFFTEDEEHRGWVELVSGDRTEGIGLSKIGANNIPAGCEMVFRYKNTGTEAIRVVIRLEFLY